MARVNSSFLAAADVTSLCTDLFKSTGINCFSYSRVYEDRSRAELWSDPHALHHTFIEKKYIVGAYTPIYYGEDERYALLESKIDSFPRKIRNEFQAQVRDQRTLFDHAHPLKVINKGGNYCEYFLFYASASNSGILGFYINHLDIIENFLKFFATAARALIERAAEDRLVRAELAHDRKPHLGSAPLTVRASHTSIPSRGRLTRRQLEIAQYVIDGRTAREIGQQLDLSQRTIESHIDSLKTRLDCGSRAELIVRLSQLGFSPGTQARL